ncbi:uncharacterized protein TNIN_152701 [Trichonephila inaurata madagascariensis]|uniref:Uncharacterized protein n=1 Tax=Trichonephila inaurata madagascariensis TaxID=2747483 RepID=A0A8X7CK76_9ARAC|nr:uncharacterized protein TNIN_152701 [Trichonephila inaurata madagascariensis]
MIRQGDCIGIMQLYFKITHTVAYADDFLCFPVFFNVLSSMSGLFLFCYGFVFFPGDDFMGYLFAFIGMIHYLTIILLTMVPAAASNRTSKTASYLIDSLPGWFPRQYKNLNTYICKRFKIKFYLTLWKIYVINESLLISAFGTFLTYGFLVGTIGITQDSSTRIP